MMIGLNKSHSSEKIVLTIQMFFTLFRREDRDHV